MHSIQQFFLNHHCENIHMIQHREWIEIQSPYPIEFLKTKLEAAFPKQTFKLSSDIRPSMTQLPGLMIKNIKNAIAIVSGKGGVGKSTVACNLAIANQILGAQVGLLDADIYGPSLPTMMGIKTQPDISTDHRYLPPKSFGVECMSMGLLQKEGPLIWRGPMLAKALLQMLDQTAWSALDYLYLDLPPGTGDIPLSLIQKIPLSGAVIVTTPQTIATLDAQKAIEMFLKTNVKIIGLIANMAWHECSQCQHQNFIFGEHGARELARRYQIPLLAEIPLDSQIRTSSDDGTPIVHLSNHPLHSVWLNAALKICQSLCEIAPSPFPPIRQV